MMKSQVEELRELRKMTEAQDVIERKWAQTLFHYKQEQEALGSHVEALIEEENQKENVLIDLELMNLKNVSLLNYEEFKSKIT